jgi:hypothetical protein
MESPMSASVDASLDEVDMAMRHLRAVGRTLPVSVRGVFRDHLARLSKRAAALSVMVEDARVILTDHT